MAKKLFSVLLVLLLCATLFACKNTANTPDGGEPPTPDVDNPCVLPSEEENTVIKWDWSILEGMPVMLEYSEEGDLLSKTHYSYLNPIYFNADWLADYREEYQYKDGKLASAKVYESYLDEADCKKVYTLDGEGKIKRADIFKGPTLETPTKRYELYEYHANGKLSAVKLYEDGELISSEEYDENGGISKITEMGASLSYTTLLDSEGRTVSAESKNNKITVEYTDGAPTRYRCDLLSLEIESYYDLRMSDFVKDRPSKMTLDISQSTKKKCETEFSFDSEGRVIKAEYKSAEGDSQPTLERSYELTYNEQGLVATEKSTTTFSRGETSYSYNEDGKILKVTNALAGNVEEEYTYDGEGRLLSYKNLITENSDTYEYDSNGILKKATSVRWGEETEIEYYPNGNYKSYRDSEAYYEFPAVDYLYLYYGENGVYYLEDYATLIDNGETITERVLDEDFNVISEKIYDSNRKPYKELYYDGNGRLTEEKQYAVSTGSFYIRYVTKYDADGTKTVTEYNKSNTAIKLMNYDKNGELEKEVDVLNGIVTTVSKNWGETWITTEQYSQLIKLVIISADGKTRTEETDTYYADGNIKTVTVITTEFDDNGVEINYEKYCAVYDENHNIVSETLYDKNGNVIS